MTYGSNVAVENTEDACREQNAQLIARIAAELVAARGVGRSKSIDLATEWLRNELEAEADPTGSLAVESSFPRPSKGSPNAQVAAIAAELLDAARDAANGL